MVLGRQWDLGAWVKDNTHMTQASKFVDSLTRIEEPVSKQIVLAILWAGGVYVALGPMTASLWAAMVIVAIGLPHIRAFRDMLLHNPYGIRAQVLNLVTAVIWGIAPFMVWHVGKGQYDTLAITMLGIGFLQVISKYRSEPRPAILVAIPYLMLIGWFLYQSRMSSTFIVAVLITFAYLLSLFGFVWAGHRSKNAILAYKLEQDRLKEELETAVHRAEQANQDKSAFLANMSHELRTPLNGILGLSDVLQNEDLTAGQKRKISLIQDSGQTLLTLLNDILDLSKIEADGVKLENLEIDLDELLQKLYAFWKPLADKKRINLVFQKQKDLPHCINADPTRIRQCVNNLLSNALKFTPKNGQVVVTVTAKTLELKYWLNITVQDTGIGISEENLSKLFTPFRQADKSTTRKFGGTGLGLTITRKLCRLMGGDVNVRSVLGQGTVFTISVPVEVVEKQQKSPEPVTVGSSHITGFEGLRCLVVEDNEINLEVLLLLLEPYQMDVVVTRNGREAIEVLDTQYIDLVLMDLQMPVLGGIEATKEIRTCKKPYSGVPIIAMTANAMEQDKKRCLNEGMNAYIPKPLGRSILSQTMQEVLQPKIRTTPVQHREDAR